MRYFHGAGRHGPYFEGWYLKQQGSEGELAVIPAFHQTKKGVRSASIQVITAEGSRLFSFPAQSFAAWPDRFQVRVGGNWFSEEGMHLELEEGGFSLRGDLRYGPLSPPEEDIMGPFRRLPGMECVHGVLSMEHRVDGELVYNGRSWMFRDGRGYLETDRGRSFPRRYLWTQCLWQERQRGSLMLSVARIPVGPVRFTGCICQVDYAGRHWRLATYHGVRVERWSRSGAVIRQGALRLVVDLLEQNASPLRAPAAGDMSRTIHESLCAKVRYRFWADGALVFDHTDGRASYEYAQTEP